MALNFIAKFQPVLDNGSVKKMENDLNTRFKRVAQTFGAGLANAAKNIGKGIKFAMGAGGILGIISLLTNPLNSVLEQLDNTLRLADEVQTNSTEYGVTPAQYSTLINVLKSKGIDEEAVAADIDILRSLQQQAKEGKDTTLSQFTSIAGGQQLYEEVLKSIMDIKDPTARYARLEAVFGRKKAGKYRELLQQGQGGIDRLKNELQTGAGYNKQIDRVGALEDQQAERITKLDQEFAQRRLNATDQDLIDRRMNYERQKRELELGRYKSGAAAFDLATVGMKLEQALDQVLMPIGKALVASGILSILADVITKSVAIITGFFSCIAGFVRFFGGAKKEDTKKKVSR
jgi:hypothetical protein